MPTAPTLFSKSCRQSPPKDSQFRNRESGAEHLTVFLLPFRRKARTGFILWQENAASPLFSELLLAGNLEAAAKKAGVLSLRK